MKKIYILICLFCIFISACSVLPQPTPTATATPIPTNTPLPTATFTSIPTLTSTTRPRRTPYPTKTAIPIATQWEKTYPTKNALIIYGTENRNEYTIDFIGWGDFYLEPYFVLYADGEIIFGTGASEKKLLPDETNEILSTLIKLGLFQIQDTYAADPDNPLYSFPDGVMPDPNLNFGSVVLTVNWKDTKSLRYMKGWEQYLAQPMKAILSYLDSISSVGATSYQPDRILVAIREVEMPTPDDIEMIPWPNEVTSPKQRSNYDVLYLEGSEAVSLYKATGGKLYGYYSFEGKGYSIYPPNPSP